MLGGNRAQAKIVVSVVTAFSVSSEKFSSKLRKVMKIFSRCDSWQTFSHLPCAH